MVICSLGRRLNVCRLRLLKSPLSSRDNRVRWHAKTIMVIPFYLFGRLLQSLFVIQRQSSPMACKDHHGHLILFVCKTIAVSLCHLETIESDGMRRPSWSFAFHYFQDYCSLCLLSRDNQVRWHVETIMVVHFHNFRGL